MRLAGLILAGGRSRRMGRAKEALPFGGTTLLGQQCRTLLACTAPVVVVARGRDQQLPDLPAQVETILDDEPDQGPLPAIAAGLLHLERAHGFGADDAAFVTGCDLPFLTADAVRWLLTQLGDAQVVMPEARGHLHPLAAIYRLAARQEIDRRLAAGRRSPSDLGRSPSTIVLDEARLRAFEPSMAWLDNVNDPSHYAAALRRHDETPP